MNIINELINREFNDIYLKWKRKNVSARGFKNENDISNNTNSISLGKGLYSVPLSNISMAKQYGEVRYLVNAIPKNPKIFNNLNESELFIQNKLIKSYCDKYNNNEYDSSFFYNNTDISIEMKNLGFDGIIIKGREYVNYSPPNNVYVFKTELQVYNYFIDNMKELNIN